MAGLQAALPKTVLDEWNMRLHEWPEVKKLLAQFLDRVGTREFVERYVTSRIVVAHAEAWQAEYRQTTAP
jgi:hypothetical protein